MRRKRLMLAVMGLVLAVGAGLVIAQNTLNYMQQGGGAWVVGGTQTIASGGTLTVASGGTLAIASGATATVSGSALAGIAGFTQNLVLCGDDAGTTVTNYLGPSVPCWKSDGSDCSLASTACSALDSTTEATADLPVSTLAMKVVGMRCISDSTQGSGESLTMTLRTAAADTVPAISCAIGVGATECRTNAVTTTNIAANATLAVKVVPSGDNAAGHVWCAVTMLMP